MICKPCALGVDTISEMHKYPNYLGVSAVKSVDGDPEAVDDRELFFRTAVNLHSFCQKNCDCKHQISVERLPLKGDKVAGGIVGG